MTSPIQWGVDQLTSALNSVIAGADEQRAAVAANRAALAELERQQAMIPGPPAPDRWNPLTEPRKRQARIEATYNLAAKRFADFAAGVRAFLTAHGIRPSAGLSGLGLGPLVVPIALIAGASVALGIIAWLRDANSAQSKALALQRQALAALLGGQLDQDAYRVAVQNAEHAATAAMPQSDPLGLSGLAGALVPLAIVVAVIVLGPPLVRALEGGRRRRVAA